MENVVDQEPHLYTAVGGLQCTVQEQLTREVALPQVILQIEGLVGQSRKLESSPECLSRIAEQTNARVTRVVIGKSGEEGAIVWLRANGCDESQNPFYV